MLVTSIRFLILVSRGVAVLIVTIVLCIIVFMMFDDDSWPDV